MSDIKLKDKMKSLKHHVVDEGTVNDPNIHMFEHHVKNPSPLKKITKTKSTVSITRP